MLPIMQLVTDQLKRRNNLVFPLLSRQLNRTLRVTQNVKKKKTQNNTEATLSSLVKPVSVKPASGINVGSELVGELNTYKITRLLYVFSNMSIVQKLAKSSGLDDNVFNTAMKDFRVYCATSKSLPTDLHIVLHDVCHNNGNPTDIFPYFLQYAKQMYPHINYIDDLKKISDLRNPPSWYPLARSKKRKIIFHAGPTNSGKTYEALKRFMSAKSGVYCGPLKLLANEVFNKCNKMDTPCDLITGEERRHVRSSEFPASHVACTVEMTSIQTEYEVAVIDEIQMLRDPTRGWAWTRALLGVVANEVYVCGEKSAVPIVESICLTMGEELEVKYHERLTKLEVQRKAIGDITKVEDGDCIVCFNKNDIFTTSRKLEQLGREVAVIYGSLPPGTKLAQAARFNDPKDPCKVMVATNAIGMGLNLRIRRVIFYSLTHSTINENNEVEKETLSVSSALQIAGRAGRYGTEWETGYVTTYHPEDLDLLEELLSQSPDSIERAGLHPTLDQIELYAYYLPNARLSDLISIFTGLCELDDSSYFICDLHDFKFIADLIEHIPLPLHVKYVFCCSPVDRKVPLACNMLLKFARQYSNGYPATSEWLKNEINWPLSVPNSVGELIHLESVYDVLDLYLWYSYRMPDMFMDQESVRELQKQLDKIIEKGIWQITALFKNKERSAIEKKLNDDTVNKNKLSTSLVSRGLLTPELLHELKMEWLKENGGKMGSESSKDFATSMRKRKLERKKSNSE